jgi:pectate lyase
MSGSDLNSDTAHFKGIDTMNSKKLPGYGLRVLLLLLPTTASFAEDIPIGWASVDGGTTGGQGGAIVTVSDPSSLVAQAESKLPLIIRVSGTIHLTSPVRVKSTKTIVGMGQGATIQGGGFHITKVSNIIIRNLTITGATDAINVEGASHHIWVDHCDLSNCTDGLLDIKHGSDFVTVSWNHFHNHHKTCLLGHSDKDEIRQIDTGHLRVTYHHNFFDGTKTRHPRVRYAEPVHVFNNYFKNNEYGVAALMDSGVLVEGNVFENVEHPTHTQSGDSPGPGRLVERDNIYIKSGAPEVRGSVAEPRTAYRYTLDKPADIAASVGQGAGPGKLASW